MANSLKRYRVEILRDPQKLLARLPQNTRRQIQNALDSLGEEPRPKGTIKLKRYDDLYRVRVGDWRIIYAIEDEQLVVLVIEIGSRGGVYQGLSR